MGTWSTSITGNDTAEDLKQEYAVAFWKFEVSEALRLLDGFVRQDFDESDPEEWVNYIFSLADFMWKKGILTDEVRDRAISMIDSGFGLDIWEESGEKVLQARKKVLAAFRKKLLSPQPPKKKIKPNIHAERIFNDGDIIAIELQTAGKPYTEGRTRAMTEEDFHALDGKYVLMQLVECKPSWRSSLIPEIGDYWATFRLFDGIYDAIPQAVDLQSLKLAEFVVNGKFSPYFYCESNMYYFKRRRAQVLGTEPASVEGLEPKFDSTASVSFAINRPWTNPDSDLLAAMGKESVISEYRGFGQIYRDLVRNAISYGKFDYRLTKQENEEHFYYLTEAIAERALAAEKAGGRILQLIYGGVMVGVLTVKGKRLEDLYIRGDLQSLGFGAKLLQHGLSCIESGAYLDVPAGHAVMIHICEKIGLKKSAGAMADAVRYCEDRSTFSGEKNDAKTISA